MQCYNKSETTGPTTQQANDSMDPSTVSFVHFFKSLYKNLLAGRKQGVLGRRKMENEMLSLPY